MKIIDFDQLAEDHGLDARWNGNWLQFNCPFCDDDGFHAAWHSGTGVMSCFRCGKLSVTKTCSSLFGLTAKELDRVHVKTTVEPGEEVVEWNKKITEVELPLNTYPVSEWRMASNYIKNRGLSPFNNSIYCTTHLSNYPFRIIIPIYYEGKLISWQGRTYMDQEPKYLNLSDHKQRFPMKQTFYNWTLLEEEVVLCEGIFDVWSGKLLYPELHFIASFGKQLTERQLSMLSSRKKVWLALDKEAGTRKEVRKIRKQLTTMGVEVENLDFEGNDLNDALKIKNGLTNEL